MKSLLFAFVLFIQCALFAQSPCEFDVNVNDCIGTFKETRSYLVHEKNFAGTSSYAYLSVALVDNMPLVKLQLISRSKDFITSNCLDKSSRLFVQLDNGQIVTLMHINELTCGTTVRTDQGYNNYIITGTFMFVKGAAEQLLASPASFMRVKFTTNSSDYIFVSNLKSELDGKTYDPQHYFINTLNCLQDQ